jgi:2,4'-dihydroxyacetophenone dioxygenase
MVSLLKPAEHITETKPHKPAFFNPNSLAWTPWVMPGTWFKLLNLNPITGGFSMLLKVSADNEAPIHGHIGSVEAYIIEGGFGYGADRGRTGWYIHEAGGINHRPDADIDGVIMFAVAHGPLFGYNPDGSIAGIVDAKAMYALASQAGVAAHLDKAPQWNDLA